MTDLCDEEGAEVSAFKFYPDFEASVTIVLSTSTQTLEASMTLVLFFSGRVRFLH